MKKFISILLALSLLGGVFMPVISYAKTSPQTSSLGSLKVNNFYEPVGIDTKNPAFSFVVNSAETGSSLSAYRIIVSEDNTVVWDSGKTASQDCYDIKYNGNALKSKTKYTWNVEAWNEKDESLGVSPNSTFMTGFLNSSEWTAKWISSDSINDDYNFNGAKWIWLRNGAAFNGSPATSEYFRKSFNITSTVKSAILIFTADDTCDAYINGISLGSSTEWAAARKIDVTDKIRSDKNVLAFKATNSSVGYAGLLTKLYITYENGTSQVISSDNTFKTSLTYANNYYDINFVDTSWVAPDQQENYSNSPWGNNVVIGQSTGRNAPIFRKNFSINKEIKSATAFVCAAGLYDIEFNGEKPDESVLKPANTDYNKSLLYTAYDITGLLNSGDNAVGVMLGNGFYNSIMPGWNWSQATWRTNPKLRMEITVKYTDGSSENIITDGSFKYSSDGPITENDIYYGETYDANKEIIDYSLPTFDDSSWNSANVASAPNGTIKHQAMEPIVRTQSYDVTVTKNKNGSYIVKSPVVTAGWLSATFNQPKNTELTITYGEKLNNNGLLVTKEDGGRTTQRDKYICKGSNDYYEPRFSYKGYQYVQIDGAVNAINANDIKALKINNDVENTGTFNCSNELVNGLHDMMTRTILNNIQGKITDTPFLEKNGWLGDANVALETFNYNFQMSGVLQKILIDMEDGQLESGLIPSLVPIYNWGIDNVPVWNTIFIFAVEEMYKIYGNKSLISSQYAAMKKLMDLDISVCKNNSWVWNRNDNYSDWVSPMGGENLAYMERCPEGAAIYQTAYVYKALLSIADMAQKLGKTDDYNYFIDAANKVKNGFNKKYYNATKGIYESESWETGLVSKRTRYRQSSNIIALAFELVENNNIQTVVSNLVNDIKSKGNHLDTGMIGTKFILPTLCKFGYSDIAYRILTQETYPSWGFWYVNGATTTHEMWETTARSLDHYFLGTYDEWLYKGLGGIDNIKEGYKTFTYAPQTSNDLDFVNVSVDTVRGLLKTGYTRNSNGGMTFKLKVPFGSTVNALLPVDSENLINIDSQALSLSIAGVKAYSKTQDNKISITMASGEYEIVCDSLNSKIYKESLDSAIKSAKSLKQYDYNSTSWTEFQTALNSAESVFDSSVNQYEVNNSVEILKEKIAGLNSDLNLSRKTLRDLLTEIEVSGLSKKNLEKNYWTEFEQKLNSAKEILSIAADDSQVIASTNELSLSYLDVLKNRIGNIAENKPVFVSSDVNNSDWSAFKLTDNNKTNQNSSGEYCGWSSASDLNNNHEEWAVIDLQTKQSFDTVTIYPSTSNPKTDKTCYGLPEDYKISISDDNATWTDVYEAKAQPLIGYKAVDISVGRQTARYVKITGTKLRQKVSDGNTYRMQLAEVQIYNRITDGFKILDNKTYLYIGGSPIVSAISEFNGDKYYCDYSGVVQTSRWFTLSSKRYYANADGKIAKGMLVNKDGKYYCFNEDSSLITSQWIDYQNNKYYASLDGSLCTNIWTIISNNDYYFDSLGRLQVNGIVNGYAVNQDGLKVKNSLVNYQNKSYLTDAFGKIINGTSIQVYKNKSYILGSDNSIVKGNKLVNVKSDTYFVGKNGSILKNADFTYLNSQYRASKSGAIYKNKIVLINKNYYAFNKDGKKYTGTKIIELNKNKYYIKKSCIKKNFLVTYKNKTYFTDKKGIIVKNKKVTISKKTYYFNSKGYMVKNKSKYKIKNKFYKIGKNGIIKLIKKL